MQRRGGDLGPNRVTRGGGASGGFVDTRTNLVDSGLEYEKIATNRKW